MLGLTDKYLNPASDKWANLYWTIIGVDGSLLDLYADAIHVEPGGALVCIRKGEPFLAVNAGLWHGFHASSILNGAPMGVDRHTMGRKNAR